MRLRGMFLVVMGSMLLGGCASAERPSLYYWPGYQEQVYAHFQNATSAEQQIDILEKHLQKAQSSGMTPAPGYYAQLGMLYSMVGRMDEAVPAFEREQALFPESEPYMRFLMRNINARHDKAASGTTAHKE